MVKVCLSSNYPKENEEKYKEYFEKYNFPLHIFQKWSIEAIVEGNHVLVCCPTGSGKTLPGEFALDYFHSKGKKTIYTCPIKSLSNEKFYSFTKKYPHINVGLITGDLKFNTNADVIICTTEILMNKLYQTQSKDPNINNIPNISFEMDIQTELGCVVFDEIHFINDESRGHVWEQSIMMLPSHVQIIGLSATLYNPEGFAGWLETKGKPVENVEKVVYLTTKKDRAVPLTHYSFITTPSGIFKVIKDKALQEEIKSLTNKPFVIQNAKGEFNESHYYKMSKMLKLFENQQMYTKRQHVLNEVSKYLVENEMLPALCYVFSRKQVEKCAKEITTNLLEFDSKVPYTIDYECEQIIRKLPNWEEYIHLPEYVETVALLRKGIAMHHSGITPILREMVEILFARGYIKILFCTETVAIGLNLPVKTTIFTDVNKPSENGHRILYAHEYTQSSGRAGRLGLDTVGNVIHLNNLFRNVDLVSYKCMLNGKPQVLTSKFKISYSLLLSLIDIGDQNFCEFAQRSMIQGDIENELKEQKEELNLLEKEMDKFNPSFLRTNIDVVNEYIELNSKKDQCVNKKRKEVERALKQIIDNNKFIEQDTKSVSSYKGKQQEYEVKKRKYQETFHYLENNVGIILKMLENDGFIEKSGDEKMFKLSFKGYLVRPLREVHGLVFSNLLFPDNFHKDLSTKELVSVFSCFTNVNVNEDFKSIQPDSSNIKVNELMKKIHKMYIDYEEKEAHFSISTGVDYTVHFDLMKYVVKWCDCTTEEECKFVIQTLQQEKDIFLGEFVKALLKINNICSEMEAVAEYMGDMEFLGKLKEIPGLTLKFVVTNQSLYV